MVRSFSSHVFTPLRYGSWRMCPRSSEAIIKNLTDFDLHAHLLTKFKMFFSNIHLICLCWVTFQSLSPSKYSKPPTKNNPGHTGTNSSWPNCKLLGNDTKYEKFKNQLNKTKLLTKENLTSNIHLLNLSKRCYSICYQQKGFHMHLIYLCEK